MAAKQVYTVRTNISQARWEQFVSAEIRLRKAGIRVPDYAMTVAKLWRNWCKHKGMKCVPINVFLGNKSMEMYLKFTRTKPTIDLSMTESDKDSAALVADEVTVALLYIRSANEGLNLTINDIAAIADVSDAWIAAKSSGMRPISKALDIIKTLHHTPDATTYDEVISHANRQKQVRVE